MTCFNLKYWVVTPPFITHASCSFKKNLIQSIKFDLSRRFSNAAIIKPWSKMFENIMNRVVWKCFLCTLHFQWSLRFLVKAFIWLKKVSSTKTLPIGKVDSFLKSSFDLNQTCKIVLTQNHEIWNFTATELLDIFVKDRRKVFGW